MSKKTEALLQQILEKLDEIVKNQHVMYELTKEVHGTRKAIDKETKDQTGKIKSLLSNIDNDIWTDILKKRKIAYYKKIRNDGIKSIYEKYLKEEPPYIPRKFKESSIPGETEAQTARMKKLEIVKLELEIERLEEEKVKNDSIITNSECEIKKLISKDEDPENRQKLTEIWFSEIKNEESISNGIWERKAKFFSQEKEANNKTSNDSEQNTRKEKFHSNYRKNVTNGPHYYKRRNHYHRYEADRYDHEYGQNYENDSQYYNYNYYNKNNLHTNTTNYTTGKQWTPHRNDNQWSYVDNNSNFRRTFRNRRMQ